MDLPSSPFVAIWVTPSPKKKRKYKKRHLFARSKPKTPSKTNVQIALVRNLKNTDPTIDPITTPTATIIEIDDYLEDEERLNE